MTATCPYPEPDQSSPCPPFHFKIHINIILPTMHGSSEWSLSLRFLHQNPVYTSPLSIRATCPAHLILLDFITRTIFGEKFWTQSYFVYLLFCNSLEFRDMTLNFQMMWWRADVVDLLYGRYLVRILPNTGCFNRLFRGFPQCHDSRLTCFMSQSLPSKSSPFHNLWWIRGIPSLQMNAGLSTETLLGFHQIK